MSTFSGRLRQLGFFGRNSEQPLFRQIAESSASTIVWVLKQLADSIDNVAQAATRIAEVVAQNLHELGLKLKQLVRA